MVPSIEHSDDDDFVSPPLPVCRKKALLIGIQNYASTDMESSDEGHLKGPHVDVLNMRQLLLGNVFRCHHPLITQVLTFCFNSRCLPL